MIAMLYTRNSLQKIHILRTLQITEKEMGGTFIIAISIIFFTIFIKKSTFMYSIF